MKKLIFIFTILIPVLGFAQESQPLSFSGSMQLRGETDGRDFNNATAPNIFTAVRTRLAATAMLIENAKVVLEFQDTRTLGGEPSTLSNSPSFGAHQVYVMFPLMEGLSVQAGRFEMPYGNERIFGSVGWSMVGRSFDGIRFKTTWLGNLDFFALTIKEVSGVIVPKQDTGSDIFGAWLNLPMDGNVLNAYGFFESIRDTTQKGTKELDRFTTGGDYTLKTDGFSVMVEGAYQFGTLGDVDIAAWMASASFTLHNPLGEKTALTAGADFLSGTSTTAKEINTFDISYGTNHKFYGYMDYFLANKQTGLQDFYLKLKMDDLFAGFSLMADGHFFNGFEETVAKETAYGTEIDLTLSKVLLKGLKCTWGGSVFMPGDVMKTTYGGIGDPSFWTYLQLNVAF